MGHNKGITCFSLELLDWKCQMTKRSAKLPLVWLTTILTAFFSLVIGDRIGKAGDCSPGQIDGQCGLSTFVGLLYGAIGGIVVLACATVYTVVYFYRRRKNAAGSDRTSSE